MQTLTDFLNTTTALDTPGTYEIYELESDDNIARRFVIKNTLTNRSILLKSYRNKLEIDLNFIDYNNYNFKKISITRLFERINGLGIQYI